MCKDTSNNSIFQEKMLFSLPETISDKKICIDFNAPDMSSNGGLMLFHFMAPFLAMAELKRALFYSSGLTKTLGNMHGSLANRTAHS